VAAFPSRFSWIGTETTDPMALSAGGVLHWDGQSWSQPISGEARMSFTVGGSGPDDVWALPFPSHSPSVTARNRRIAGH